MEINGEISEQRNDQNEILAAEIISYIGQCKVRDFPLLSTHQPPAPPGGGM